MTYQSLKPNILNFFAVIVTLLLTKRSVTSFSVLFTGFLLSVAMEMVDLYEDYQLRGVLEVGSSLHDLVNTNIIPVMLVLMFRFKKVRV